MAEQYYNKNWRYMLLKNHRLRYFFALVVVSSTVPLSLFLCSSNRLRAVPDSVDEYTKALRSFIGYMPFRCPFDHHSCKEFKRLEQYVKQETHVVCPNTTRPHGTIYVNDDWQTAVTPSSPHQIMLYSAFYDDRQATGYLPVIRVLGIASINGSSGGTTNQTRQESDLDLDMYCQIWYAGKENPLVSKAKFKITGFGVVRLGLKYADGVFTCPLKFSVPYPTYVSVVKGNKCSMATSLLEVQVPIRSQWTKQFGMCVGYVSGDIDYNYLTEWMELHLMYGIEHITIYHGYISQDAQAVLKSYVSEGVVDLRETLPPMLNYDTKDDTLALLTTANDCMYRHMYHYHHMLIGQFSRVIVPRMHDSYANLMSHIDKLDAKHELYHSYSFSNVNFWLNLAPDFSISGHLVTLRYVIRSVPEDPHANAASFIDARLCFYASAQSCAFPLHTRSKVHYVKPTLALSHKYENCQLTSEECKMLTRGTVVDKTVSKFYGDQLLQRVDARIQMIAIDDE